jgi:hypothetical protein
VTLVVPLDERRAVAARVTGSTEAELVDWSVERIQHEAIIDTTGGLFRVRATTRSRDEERSWSCVVKVLNRSDGIALEPHGWCYWRREAEFSSAGLGEALPPSIRAPRPLGVSEHDDGCWVWMEHIEVDAVPDWGMDDFHRVAVASGSAAGSYLGGRVVPSAPWLASSFVESIFADGGFWAVLMDADQSTSAWDSMLVTEAFSEKTRERVLTLWSEKDRFLSALAALPQVFCHGDFHRRNVILPVDVQEVPVVVDWAFCGPGAVGADLADLVVGTLYFGDVDVSAAARLQEVALDGYLEGLRRSGWEADRRLVELGYETFAALWMGATLPGWVALMLEESEGVNVEALYGRPALAVRDDWVTLDEFALDLADKSRRHQHLIRH